MTTETKAHRKGAGRVAFLARADLFRELLNAGHPQRSIYDDHATDLGISYSQFNRYVGKYLLGKTNDEHQKGISPASTPGAEPGNQPAASGNASPGKPASASKPTKPGFQHNPNSGNDRDDLI